jgi:type IV pilus assembly protein PilC
VLNISRGVSYYWGYGLITSVVFIINSTLLVKHVPYAKRLVEQAKLTIPLIRDLLRKRYSAESATLLASLLGAGIPIIQALEIVTATVQNSVIAEQLSFMRSALYDGASLSGALESATFFPPLVKQMVGVGEVSGRLEEMLAKVGAHFAEEVESFLKTLHDLVEPALVLMIGLVVGTLVLAIYLPLFQIGEVASLG